jgi:hypothetical protein
MNVQPLPIFLHNIANGVVGFDGFVAQLNVNAQALHNAHLVIRALIEGRRPTPFLAELLRRLDMIPAVDDLIADIVDLGSGFEADAEDDALTVEQQLEARAFAHYLQAVYEMINDHNNTQLAFQAAGAA